MCRRLTKFLFENNVLYSGQYGFLQGRSTEHAMLDILYKITDAIEKKHFTLGVFLDLSKAFDTISHSILLKKLSIYGIRGIGLDWLTSYLKNRTQFIDTGITQSSILHITSGVPQGSVLGPLLFLLYINDMPLFSQILSYVLFADDTTALYSSPSINDLFTVINNELATLQKWFSASKLQINATKTNLILFTTHQREKHFIGNNENQYLFLSNSQIRPTSSVRFLGLQLDKNLTFKKHINFVCSKLTKGIYALSRAAKVLPTEDLMTLYFSLFLPYINYGLLAWGGSCKTESYYQVLDRGPMTNHMRSLTKIHQLQKRALRIISKRGFYSHHIPLCWTLQILDLEHLYNLKALSLFHDYYHGKLPPFFLNKLTLYYSRNNSLLIQTKFRRTDIASCNYFNTIPNVWNPLPDNLKSVITKSKKTFLTQAKSYFISTYENWKCPKNDCFICHHIQAK